MEPTSRSKAENHLSLFFSISTRLQEPRDLGTPDSGPGREPPRPRHAGRAARAAPPHCGR